MKQISIEEWYKIAAVIGLQLSPNDLHLIAAGLGCLANSQRQLATLARDQGVEGNLAEYLQAHSEQTDKLMIRIVEYHAKCMVKAAEETEKGSL
jgi:hypothetical protein